MLHNETGRELSRRPVVSAVFQMVLDHLTRQLVMRSNGYVRMQYLLKSLRCFLKHVCLALLTQQLLLRGLQLFHVLT